MLIFKIKRVPPESLFFFCQIYCLVFSPTREKNIRVYKSRTTFDTGGERAIIYRLKRTSMEGEPLLSPPLVFSFGRKKKQRRREKDFERDDNQQIAMIIFSSDDDDDDKL